MALTLSGACTLFECPAHFQRSLPSSSFADGPCHRTLHGRGREGSSALRRACSRAHALCSVVFRPRRRFAPGGWSAVPAMAVCWAKAAPASACPLSAAVLLHALVWSHCCCIVQGTLPCAISTALSAGSLCATQRCYQSSKATLPQHPHNFGSYWRALGWCSKTPFMLLFKSEGWPCHKIC